MFTGELNHSLTHEGANGVSLHRLQDTHANWTLDSFNEAAREGHWAVEPPKDWRALGIAYSLLQFVPGVILVRHAIGLTLERVRQAAKDSAGILCEDPKGCVGLGVPVFVVPDIRRATYNLGSYARDRYQGKVIGLTGSVGKTTTTYLLAGALAAFGKVDYSRASSNIGIATGRIMASMSLDIPFWVIEMTFDKMRTASSIARPHIGIVLSISEAHLDLCKSIRRVAEIKSRIFDGMSPGGIAILNSDMREYDVVEAAAKRKGLTIIRFGACKDADIRLLDHSNGVATVQIEKNAYRFACTLPRHIMTNALAVMACVYVLGLPVEKCFGALQSVRLLPGRGRTHNILVDGKRLTIIDDSFNANPASMTAGLAHLRDSTPSPGSRVAILGDFAALGDKEAQKHIDMLEPVKNTQVDRILLCGPLMRNLWDLIKTETKGAWFPEPQALKQEVISWLKDGDTVIIKSSGHKLTDIVELLLQINITNASDLPAYEASSPAIAFGGDVNLGRRQHYISRQRGYSHALGGLPILREADLSIINLECVVSTKGRHKVDKGETGPFYYRARPEQLRILQEAGIKMVATANNHSGDYGPEALLEQRAWLDAAGLSQAGSGCNIAEASAPAYVRLKEYTAAVFSVDATMRYFAAGENKPGIWYMPLHNPDLWYKELVPRIAAARRQAHVVLVAVHWGANNEQEPKKSQIDVGHAIIAAGADAVLGSSAHNLQGLEVYKNRPIIHDAGNLLFDAPRTDSGVFTLRASPHGITEVRFLPVVGEYGFSMPASGDDASRGIADFAAKSARMGTTMEVFPDHARVSLTPPRRPSIAPFSQIQPAQPGQAPPPPSEPRPEWVVDVVPDEAKIEPTRLGPLTLLGLWIHPEHKQMGKRQIIWVETYWSINEPLRKDLLLDIQAKPVRGDMPPFGARMWHDPCDWMWPTSRWKPGVIYKDVAGLRPPPPKALISAELSVICGVLEQNTLLGSYTSPQPLFFSLQATTAG